MVYCHCLFLNNRPTMSRPRYFLKTVSGVNIFYSGPRSSVAADCFLCSCYGMFSGFTGAKHYILNQSMHDLFKKPDELVLSSRESFQVPHHRHATARLPRGSLTGKHNPLARYPQIFKCACALLSFVTSDSRHGGESRQIVLRPKGTF